MNKEEKFNSKDARNQNHEAKKMNTSGKSKKKNNRDLPWWVELLFVQIGLPDRLLIKILKTNRDARELVKNEKKSFITIFFIIIVLAYFYPVIKHSKNKLDCESFAKNYIIKNKSTNGFNNKKLRMLSTNFCYGGRAIFEIDNF
ncbi:putative membrane protein [Prochlorococcus marinus str. MIT 9201]|uniref:Putative membrane protein n=1 Tax=Prochlorococcus marinus str. MIT 9201 TaxID=93057 RepID=A0A0A2A1T8_PROMR|nr:hypothetical protein [Prochlorococcus marinus]KGF95852.1 putative membrane protein [Prochlorococcus marinus str. MIT 9201]